ncbi:hypothetical protein ACN3VN_10550 [Xylella fastidiosa]
MMAAPPAWRWSSASTGSLSANIFVRKSQQPKCSLDIAVIDESAASFTVKVQRRKV